MRPTPAFVVAVDVTSTLGGQLKELIRVDAFDGKLRLLPALPLELVPRFLMPASWEGQMSQELADDDGVDGGLSAAELGRVWAFIARHHA